MDKNKGLRFAFSTGSLSFSIGFAAASMLFGHEGLACWCLITGGLLNIPFMIISFPGIEE